MPLLKVFFRVRVLPPPSLHGFPNRFVKQQQTFRLKRSASATTFRVFCGIRAILSCQFNRARGSQHICMLMTDGESNTDAPMPRHPGVGVRLSRQPAVDATPPASQNLRVCTGLVSILLFAGALGIGSYSLSHVLSVPSETALSLPAWPLQTALFSITAAAHNVPGLGHPHGACTWHARFEYGVVHGYWYCLRLVVSYYA